jgi:integrase
VSGVIAAGLQLLKAVKSAYRAAHTVCMSSNSPKHRVNDTLDRYAKIHADLHDNYPDTPAWAWNVISRYRAQLPPTQWEAVRPMVMSVALSLQPTTYEAARRLMSMSARFAGWVWTVKGSEPEVARYFTEANIWRYIATALKEHSDSYRWGVVRQLGVITEILNKRQVKRYPAPNLAGATPPFKQPEVATMYSWATTRSTELKIRNACAILGLGAGAGLRSSEIAEVRVGDLTLLDGRPWVNVRGENSRRVPVLSPWETVLQRAAGGRAASEFLFHGYRLDEYPPRAIQTFLTDNPARVRPTVSRLRTTWICRHLGNGVPLGALAEAAGLADVGSLEKYLAYVDQPSLDDCADLFFGGDR